MLHTTEKCYLTTTFRCPSDILITSWLFTARRSTWPGNHLVRCGTRWQKRVTERRKNTLLKRSVSVATLPGPSTGSNETSWRNLWKMKQRTQEAITKVWLSCHMWKDWARHLQEFWNLMALPQLTILTECNGTLWFIRRTRSRMKRRPNWSIVSLARMLQLICWRDRQEVRSEDQLTQERKKWTLSQLVHRPKAPGQGRAV